MVNVCLKLVVGPHLNGEEVMIVPLELLMGRVLSETQVGEISKDVD